MMEVPGSLLNTMPVHSKTLFVVLVGGSGGFFFFCFGFLFVWLVG